MHKTRRSRVPFTLTRHPDPPADPPANPPANPPADPAANPPRTFTQEELDRIVGDRVARERAKFADYDDVKGKAEQFDKIQTEQMTELERERAARTAAETAAAEAAARADRALVEAALAKAAANTADPDSVVELLRNSADVKVVDGAVVGADEAVAKLVEARPLFRKSTTPPPPGPLPGQGAGGAGAGGRVDPTDRKAVATELANIGVRLPT